MKRQERPTKHRCLSRDGSKVTPLSARQKQITLMRFECKTKEAIAEELGVSIHTVRNIMATVYSKTGASSLLELYIMNEEQGFV